MLKGEEDMEYIRSKKIDPINTFFILLGLIIEKSIEKNGLQTVAGGENEDIGREVENDSLYPFIQSKEEWGKGEQTR